MAHHHHGHERPPQTLVVFFIPNTVPYRLLARIRDQARFMRDEFLDYFDLSPDWLRFASEKRLREIYELTRLIAEGGEPTMTNTPIQPPAGAVTQLVIGDAVGIIVAVLEADDSGAVFFPPAGPLQFVVSDPSNTVKQGVAADGVTPTFLDNGSGATGTVSVQVTDSGNNLVGTASFQVVAATPPPPKATQLGVFFVPNTAAPAAGSGSASATAAAAAAKAAGVATTVDPHNPSK